MPSNCGGLIFQYGTYYHKPGEVYPAAIEVRPQHSDYGIRWGSIYRMQIKGDFLADDGQTLDPDEITNRINELQDVYIEDYKDTGFWLSENGVKTTKTPHYMETDDEYNLSGNQVVSRSWDHIHPANEYTNTRSFSITIQALFEQVQASILFFSQRAAVDPTQTSFIALQ